MPESADAPTLLLLSDDLMTQSRVREAALPLGYRLQSVASVPAVLKALEADAPPQAVLVSLSTRRCDPFEAISALKRLPDAPPVLAFAGHVEQGKHQAARDAGADLIAANSSIALHLPALLQRLLKLKEEAGAGVAAEGDLDG